MSNCCWHNLKENPIPEGWEYDRPDPSDDHGCFIRPIRPIESGSSSSSVLKTRKKLNSKEEE